MGDWVTLAVLSAALVVPVVLMLGFAGCSFSAPVAAAVDPPILIEAKGTSVSTIRLRWTFAESPAGFIVERELAGATETQLLPAAPFEFLDKGLNPQTTYQYRVTAVLTDGGTTNPSSPVAGATLGFKTAFTAALTEDDGRGWAGETLVQRIEPARLASSGTPVRITLRASPTAAADAHVERVFISQPATAGDPYDSGPDLTPVFEVKVVIAANDTFTLPPVPYTLDHTKPLLIAVDFSEAPQSRIASVGPVAAGEAVAFQGPGAEAAMPDRQAGYQTRDRIYLVERIDVGEVAI